MRGEAGVGGGDGHGVEADEERARGVLRAAGRGAREAREGREAVEGLGRGGHGVAAGARLGGGIEGGGGRRGGRGVHVHRALAADALHAARAPVAADREEGDGDGGGGRGRVEEARGGAEDAGELVGGFHEARALGVVEGVGGWGAGVGG